MNAVLYFQAEQRGWNALAAILISACFAFARCKSALEWMDKTTPPLGQLSTFVLFWIEHSRRWIQFESPYICSTKKKRSGLVQSPDARWLNITTLVVLYNVWEREPRPEDSGWWPQPIRIVITHRAWNAARKEKKKKGGKGKTRKFLINSMLSTTCSSSNVGEYYISI